MIFCSPSHIFKEPHKVQSRQTSFKQYLGPDTICPSIPVSYGHIMLTHLHLCRSCGRQ